MARETLRPKTRVTPLWRTPFVRQDHLRWALQFRVQPSRLSFGSVSLTPGWSLTPGAYFFSIRESLPLTIASNY